MTAAANKMWMKPPTVYEATIPNAHNTTNKIAMVHNMNLFPPSL